MRILLVNKFHYLKGGSETYYFELAKLLKEHGHEVAFFAMQNDKNIKTDCKEYFVPNIDLNSNNKLKALDIIYSKTNKEKMIEAINDFKPDLIHVNNFQRQLSSSIITVAKQKNIPIVFTAHDVQAICPNITMLDNDTNICEKCLNGKYVNCIRKKCIKNSKLKSVLGALEGYYYRINKIYTKKISSIITPSNFLKEKLVQDGIPEQKITVIHNFIDTNKYNVENKSITNLEQKDKIEQNKSISDEENILNKEETLEQYGKLNKGYALYFGRLAKEKGILNLIDAFSKTKIGTLHIAGEGPEKEKILKFIKEQKLEDRVKLMGLLKQEEMKEQIKNCKFVVVPSIWYENCPYSIIEALIMSKPVVASKIGGIPELVKNNENGFTYEYDDIDTLKKIMEKLFKDEEIVKKLGENASKQARMEYSKQAYYDKIIEIYENILK